MSGQYHRDIGPVLQVFRAICRGRGWNEQLRKPKDLSPRPYPQPALPGGPSHKTSLNYYYGRDARRLVEPPLSVVNNVTKQLSSGQKETVKGSAPPAPGVVYRWD